MKNLTTITKEIEKRLRTKFEKMLDIGERTGGCLDCVHCTCDRPDLATEEEIREMYAEANELLKALNMEPIEVPEYYTEEYTKERKRLDMERFNPPVHTCRISTEMEVTGILDSLKATLNDCESD